mgnify:CR=1 FL=1
MGVGVIQQQPAPAQLRYLQTLVEICADLTNPDGSASMPRLDGNVFAGTSATRLGAVEQLSSAAARPTYVPLDGQAEAYLNARGGGNRVIVR